jgi:hypothetical protein
MINENVEKLVVAGYSENFAIFIVWDKIDKKLLTFEHCQCVLSKAIADSDLTKKNQASKLAKEKAKTFEQRQWVWRQASLAEKPEAWELVREKAESFEELQWAWDNIPSDYDKKPEVWKCFKEKAETLEQRECVLTRTTPGSKEEAESLKLLKEKTKTSESLEWAYSKLRSSNKSEIMKLIEEDVKDILAE